MYKLKQEYLMFASCDTTDEDIYEHFKSIAEDMKLEDTSDNTLQINSYGVGHGYISGMYTTFCQSVPDSCMLEFKVYEEE